MEIICQKVTQNNIEFYLGKLKFRDLLKVSTISHRTIMGFDEYDKPIYNNSIQRKVAVVRKNAIKDYLLQDEEATFPNSIILAVPSILITNEIEDTELTKISINTTLIEFNEDEPLYIQIIDGQHRFAGLKHAVDELERLGNNDRKERLLDFEFVISFFVDVTIEFQAMLFSTINRTPVKVSYDIVYDLFGLTNKDSPQKTGLAICMELNSTRINTEGRKSPFSQRIKLLGKKNKGEDSVISQQIFIKTIITLISPTIRVSEIERFKERSFFLSGGTYKTIFRQFYAKNRDNFIFHTIENFFIAVEDIFRDEKGNSYWKIGETPDNAFQRTIGFLALIDVLIELYHRGVSQKRLSTEFFNENLLKAKDIKLLDDTGKSIYSYTSRGKGELSKDLLDLIA